MTMTNCFQGTSSSCKAGITSVQATTHHSSFTCSVDKLTFPSVSRKRLLFQPMPVTLSPTTSNPRRSKFLCKAQEAVDQGLSFHPLLCLISLLLCSKC
ncbi:hypothetical protein LINPERHAP2_LOCUS17001 [Linum perenne]